MCSCTQKSKKPYPSGKGFNYKFECTDKDGNVKTIELDASNDNIAKQLAEQECENGVTLLSFAETENLMKQLSLSVSIRGFDTAEGPLSVENVTVLNPTTWTKVAQYGSGVRGCTIKLSGRWVPGIGHPSWDAYGDSATNLRGCNKWCALVQIHAGTDIVATIPWTHAKGGVMTLGYYGYPTAVIIFMNDDKYDDNTNAVDNPMTASVSLF